MTYEEAVAEVKSTRWETKEGMLIVEYEVSGSGSFRIHPTVHSDELEEEARNRHDAFDDDVTIETIRCSVCNAYDVKSSHNCVDPLDVIGLEHEQIEPEDQLLMEFACS